MLLNFSTLSDFLCAQCFAQRKFHNPNPTSFRHRWSFHNTDSDIMDNCPHCISHLFGFQGYFKGEKVSLLQDPGNYHTVFIHLLDCFAGGCTSGDNSTETVNFFCTYHDFGLCRCNLHYHDGMLTQLRNYIAPDSIFRV